MLEPWRSRYLDAMGLPSYVPRVPLPGAALSLPVAWDSEALVIPRSPAMTEAAPAPGRLEPARPPEPSRRLPEITPVAPRVRPTAQPPIEPPIERKERTAATSTGQPVHIALLVVALSPRVLLVDVARELTSAGRQLLGNVARSIGGALAEEELFRWPCAAHPQLQHSENAAREAVAGCLLRRLDGKPTQSLLVLGGAARWLDADTRSVLGSGVQRLVAGPALSEVLATAEAKRQLWLALRSIAVD